MYIPVSSLEDLFSELVPSPSAAEEPPTPGCGFRTSSLVADSLLLPAEPNGLALL